MTLKVTKVVLDKKQAAFIERDGSNGVAVISGSAEEIASVLARHENKGCKFVFNTKHAPNFKRCFNANVKRIRRISDAAGVAVSEPAEYFVDGYRQTDRYVVEIV